MTDNEKLAAKDAMRDQLEEWVTENGIEKDFMKMTGFKPGFHHPHRMM